MVPRNRKTRGSIIPFQLVSHCKIEKENPSNLQKKIYYQPFLYTDHSSLVRRISCHVAPATTRIKRQSSARPLVLKYTNLYSSVSICKKCIYVQTTEHLKFQYIITSYYSWKSSFSQIHTSTRPVRKFFVFYQFVFSLIISLGNLTLKEQLFY